MKERIKNVIKRVLNLDVVPDNISQLNCDKWDSLAHLTIVTDLEEEFNVSLEPEEIMEMKSLEKIEEILKCKNID